MKSFVRKPIKHKGENMGYKNFREVYHKLAVVMDNGYCANTFKLVADKVIPEGVEYNSVLAYGYIDKSCGFSYKVLGLTYYEDGDYTLVWPSDEIGLTVRGECFHHFEMIPVENKALEKRFSNMIRITNECYSTKEDDVLRSLVRLDKFRHEDYPDDIRVILFKEGMKPEQVWMRTEQFLAEQDGAICIEAKLLNEPYKDFGVHLNNVCKVIVSNVNGEDLAFMFLK